MEVSILKNMDLKKITWISQPYFLPVLHLAQNSTFTNICKTYMFQTSSIKKIFRSLKVIDPFIQGKVNHGGMFY